jgi:hypothetical protein
LPCFGGFATCGNLFEQERLKVNSKEYELVGAPANLTPIERGFAWSSQLVDYAKHPAYRHLIDTAGIGARIGASVGFAAKFVLLLIKRVIRYEMIPFEYRSAKTLRERIGFITTGLRNTLRLGNQRAVSKPSICSDQLAQNGCAVVTMPAARFEALKQVAAKEFNALEAKRGKGANTREFDESRATADRRSSPELFALIEELFAESGIADAANAYMGRKARLIDVNPQINDPSDRFWRDIFDDRAGEPLPRTAYCHRDASGGDLKAIIYCSDVSDETGPFTYALGSNHMKISWLDDLLCEANDHNGLSGTDLETRRKFAALPAKLRQKGSFGNDLTDDHPASAAIGKALWEIKAPQGSIVLFDTKGIHRGGMVDDGERRVITCVLG